MKVILFKHSLTYLFSKGLPGIITFLGILIYTRIVPPNEYGIYSLTVVYVGIVNAVTFQWVRSSLLRFWQDEKISKDSLISTISLTYLLIMAINSCIAILIIALDVTSASYILGGLGLLIAQSWFEMNITLLRAKLQPGTFGLLSITKSLITLLFSIALIYIGFTEHGLVIGLIIGLLCASVLSRKLWRNVRIRLFEPKILKDSFKFGMPVALSIGLGVLIFGTDRVFISLYLGLEDTGLYSVAFDFSQQTIILIMSVINLAAYPLALKSYESGGRSGAMKQFEQNFFYLLIISIPATAGLIVLSEQVVGVVFGREYREIGSYILPLIAIAAFLNGFKSYYFDLAFQIEKKTILQIYPMLLGVIVNILLNIVLIPKWGIVGAAYGSIISYLLSLVCSIFIGRRFFPLPIDIKALIKVFISTLIMVLVLVVVNSSFILIFNIIIGLISYLTSMCLLYFNEIRILIKNFTEREK